MTIALVWNAGAGGATTTSLHDLEARLTLELGGAIRVYEVSEMRDPSTCAREAVASGADIVIAAGGDGTVSGVAAELIGTAAHLAVLPMGTANSFAAALGIATDLDGAIANLVAGHRRMIDVATVRCGDRQRAMVLHCMVGLHADAIEQASPDAKRRWGVLAYAASALRQLANLTPFTAELDTGEQTIRCRAIAIAVANLAPLKTVLAHGPSHVLGDDGKVDVTIVAAETIAEAIATGLHLYRSARDGEPATRDNVGSFSSARVTIATEPVQRVLVDGEAFGETPVTIDTLPAALRVIAPPAVDAEGPTIEASLFGLPGLEIDGSSAH